MDRYDLVIRDIQEQTEGGALRWRNVAPSTWEHALNTGRTLRAYRADYALGDEEYELLFVDRKAERHEEYADRPAGRRTFEVLILDRDGEVALSLYEGAVDGDDLVRLAVLIEGRDDRTEEFFAAFEKARGVTSGGG